MQLTANDLQTLKDYFTEQPVNKAYLFGSASRNEAGDESDIDILVDLDYSTHIGLAFVTMQSDLEHKLQKKIDLVSSNGVSKYIKPFIDRDKILIYSSSPTPSSPQTFPKIHL